MSKPRNPSDIARETLTSLASRRLAPTPENYAQMYGEISGEPAQASPAAKETDGTKGKLVPAWSTLIRDLMRQLETPHKGITITRKKEGVETVLTRFASDPDVLFDKLQNLMRSWSTAPTATGADEPVPALLPDTAAAPAAAARPTVSPASAALASADNRELLEQLRELLAQTLENTLSTQPELSDEIRALIAQIRATDSKDRLNDLTKQLRQFWLKLE